VAYRRLFKFHIASCFQIFLKNIAETKILIYILQNAAVATEGQGENVMNQESGRPAPTIEPRQPDPGEWPQPPSNTGVALFFGALAVALVVGYLFVNKLVDMSQEEDCALAHRYNCGAVEVPR
jgi:hypothetical protein